MDKNIDTYLIYIVLIIMILYSMYFNNKNIKNILFLCLIVSVCKKNIYAGLVVTLFYLYIMNYYTYNYVYNENFENKNMNKNKKKLNKNIKNKLLDDRDEGSKEYNFEEEFSYMNDLIKNNTDSDDINIDNNIDFNVLKNFENVSQIDMEKILNSGLFKNVINELKGKTDNYFDMLEDSIIKLEKKVNDTIN